MILWLRIQPTNRGQQDVILRQVQPKATARVPLSPDIPETFAQDYREACLVLADSPKASAALSRRCLQHVLREAGKTKRKDLFDQIEEVRTALPGYIQEVIDWPRVIGVFAAHPMKSTHSGEIMDVEPGEAEALLDVLELLFDFYFVLPAQTHRRKLEFNRKLAEAGKPVMK